jgi:hypothetical protein
MWFRIERKRRFDEVITLLHGGAATITEALASMPLAPV